MTANKIISSMVFMFLIAISLQATTSGQGYFYINTTTKGQSRENTPVAGSTTIVYDNTPEVKTNTTKVPNRYEVTNTTENSQHLLLEILKQQNQTVRVQECQASTLAKLTSGNDVSKVCASIKQFKEILDDKCVKTEYDLLVVETMQLFNCLVCHH